MSAPWPARAAEHVPVYLGDDFALRVRFRTDTGDGTDAPTDVTGWGTWTAQARPAPGSEQIAAFTVDTTDAATGIVVFRCDAATSASMRSAGTPSWYFDAQTTVTGYVTTRFAAVLDVDMDVTR